MPRCGARRGCDGWVGTAYSFQDAAGYVRKLHAVRREHGLEKEPFEIMLALYEPPSVDPYKRAEDLGITVLMCAPWALFDAASTQPAERYRPAIEWFAETFVAQFRNS